MQRHAHLAFCVQEGYTPVYLAAQNGMSSTVELLGEMKADVNHALEARARSSPAPPSSLWPGRDLP